MATTLVNLADYLIGVGPCNVYRFPNGYTASVHRNGVDRYTIWCEALDGDEMIGLTVESVSALLTDIYHLSGN